MRKDMAGTMLGYFNYDVSLDFQEIFCNFIMVQPGCDDLIDKRNCSRSFPTLATILEARESEDVSVATKVILSILYTFITLMSLIGNSLVITTFVMDKHMRSVTNIFILSLAIADMMFTLTCVPFNLGIIFEPTGVWTFGPFACKLVPFFMTFAVACSSLTLCCIALDRYVAIVHPHKFKFLQNTKPATILLVIIWTVSSLCSLPNALFYETELIQPLCKNFKCVWPENRFKLPLEIWLTLIMLFIVPFLIMSWAYGLIGYHLWIRKPVGARRNSIRNSDMKKSVIKMLIMVMLVFVLCWSPIMVLNTLENSMKSLARKHVFYMKLYFQCLCLASSCINPIIYTFMNKKFRDKFVTYLCCNKKRIFDVSIISQQYRQQDHTVVHGQGISLGTMMSRDC